MLTHKGTKELTTKRLKLRRFTVDDAQDMFNNWASDAEVTKFVSWLPHSTPDLTRELLSKWVQEYEKPDYYSWAIEYNGRLIGSIGAPSIKERDERTGIGYCIARDCWNKGNHPLYDSIPHATIPVPGTWLFHLCKFSGNSLQSGDIMLK